MNFLKQFTPQAHTLAKMFGYRYLDMHTINYMVTGKSLSLSKAAAEYGLYPEPKPHKALQGAKYTREVFKHAYMALHKGGITECTQ
jgi:hypothetical protein